MVFVIDGIKYACQACIKGHRVAQCQHKNRTLVPLQPKGRPVSQCDHCRGNRQKNKSHVKCTCAISSVPNPINGCMCHVIDFCTCVSSALQDTSDPSTSTTQPMVDNTESLLASIASSPSNILDTKEPSPLIDQDIWNTVMSDIDTICGHPAL